MTQTQACHQQLSFDSLIFMLSITKTNPCNYIGGFGQMCRGKEKGAFVRCKLWLSNGLKNTFSGQIFLLRVAPSCSTLLFTQFCLMQWSNIAANLCKALVVVLTTMMLKWWKNLDFPTYYRTLLFFSIDRKYCQFILAKCDREFIGRLIPSTRHWFGVTFGPAQFECFTWCIHVLSTKTNLNLQKGNL